ncbi:hypothetical protein L226DRAFT_525840 [Lentinus tigrinus ALCF2SS1-7]|uniref:Uncharacterized protein n=1 Tax=Lentinus tigrinus ALCF2SS1-6 TaxID=1328759 RepID=A0A5C2RTA2_9APHY|nr:hypothetical protein L227DRAFT_567765 [Lentinus tigrinus ALCF2SS1-6]RPD70540.1 hypothetical protein L226DRAFT_525840 [Lentinus tigrinus ALCF2SS1-7]
MPKPSFVKPTTDVVDLLDRHRNALQAFVKTSVDESVARTDKIDDEPASAELQPVSFSDHAGLEPVIPFPFADLCLLPTAYVSSEQQTEGPNVIDELCAAAVSAAGHTQALRAISQALRKSSKSILSAIVIFRTEFDFDLIITPDVISRFLIAPASVTSAPPQFIAEQDSQSERDGLEEGEEDEEGGWRTHVVVNIVLRQDGCIRGSNANAEKSLRSSRVRALFFPDLLFSPRSPSSYRETCKATFIEDGLPLPLQFLLLPRLQLSPWPRMSHFPDFPRKTSNSSYQSLLCLLWSRRNMLSSEDCIMDIPFHNILSAVQPLHLLACSLPDYLPSRGCRAPTRTPIKDFEIIKPIWNGAFQSIFSPNTMPAGSTTSNLTFSQKMTTTRMNSTNTKTPDNLKPFNDTTSRIRILYYFVAVHPLTPLRLGQSPARLHALSRTCQIGNRAIDHETLGCTAVTTGGIREYFSANQNARLV